MYPKKKLLSKTLLLLTLLNLLITACASDKTETIVKESGIEGRVEIGPTCGNMPTIFDSNTKCSNKPYQVHLRITDMNRHASVARQVVAQGQSDASGYYRFSLPPGEYLLVPEETDFLSTDPVQFTVTPNTFTYQLVLYHTLIS